MAKIRDDEAARKYTAFMDERFSDPLIGSDWREVFPRVFAEGSGNDPLESGSIDFCVHMQNGDAELIRMQIKDYQIAAITGYRLTGDDAEAHRIDELLAEATGAGILVLPEDGEGGCEED